MLMALWALLSNRPLAWGAETKPAPPKAPASAKAAPSTAHPAGQGFSLGYAGKRGLSKWRGHPEVRTLFKTFVFARPKWQREFKDTSVAGARRLAGLGKAAQDELPVDTLARVLFVLEVEAPAEAKSLRAKLGARVIERHGRKVETMPEITEQTAFYHELYSVPCRGSVKRQGTTWPPHYECTEPAKDPSGEPSPLLTLRSRPRVIPPPVDADQKDKGPANKNDKMAQERQKALGERDRFAVPGEELSGPKPSQFCYQGKCHGTYSDVAAAIYGSGRGSDNMPVFCAPKEKKKSGESWVWESNKVECSAQWFDTLGGWSPWQKSGEPSSAPEAGVLPPFACFGSPHLLKEHMILPPGGAIGQTGFHCRNRIFRVLSKKAERSIEDINRNIAQMCSEMRFQVWGERYKDINSEYQKWCHGPQGPKDKSKCLPAGAPAAGMPDAPPLPYMLLSREELLFFFGHRDLYCRADRKGLVHFLDAENHGKWAKTFTCNVPRGLLESGPFEEGVQVCALAPFAGEEAAGDVSADHLKARLYCWKYERPTCEEISNPQFVEQKDSIARSNVFDAFDALLQARRTHHKDAWSLFDLKDAERLPDWRDKLAFADQGQDEGLFGVKSFCRFVGSLTNLQCGYTRDTIAQHYELHKDEIPEGCSTGVCARGAYQRGYFCGLFSSGELFAGQPYWMCGIDVGLAGRKILDDARAICVGGARARAFQSAKGDKGSLQCYERRYRFGESEKSEDLLRAIDWTEAVRAAAKHDPAYDPWLGGGAHAEHWFAKNMPGQSAQTVAHWKKLLHEGHETAKKALHAEVQKDVSDLLHWAQSYGHTLGHRTSIRLGLIHSDMNIVKTFKKLRISAEKDSRFKTLGMTCQLGKEGCPTYEFKRDLDATEDAVSKDKAKELNDLLDEVASGTRAADGRWYQSFRLAATEGGGLRVPPGDLAIALRIHHLFEIVEGARKILLKHAKDYADAVFAGAKAQKRLSRLEMHEKARRAPLPNRYKGNLFCVHDTSSFAPSGRFDYVCATSPLLVAGRIEALVDKRIGKSKRYQGHGDSAQEKMRAKVRAKVKFGWCYGGTEGQPLYGRQPSRALSEKNLSSPFEMDVPASVVGKPKARPRPAWLLRLKIGEAEGRRLETLARSGPLVQPAALGQPLPSSPDPKAAPKPPPAKAFVPLALSKLQDRLSAVNWVKCTGFQYSDEVWEEADPKREPKKEAPAALPPGPAGGDDPRAGEETAKIMKEVGGLIVSLVKVVLPKFGDALNQIQNLAHAATEFYDKYVKRFIDIAKTIWEASSGDVDKALEAVEKMKGLLDDALDDAKKKAVDAAKPSASETMLAKVKEAEAAAAAKVKEVRGKLDAAHTTVKDIISKAQKAETVPNTGELLNPLLEDLLSLISSRVMGVIEPNARSLLSKGFKFVREFLDPIAKSVISALAGIPFVGSALAALGQVAYSMAMDALENAAGDALLGVVERILSKLLRTVVTPVFKAVASKVLEMAAGACSAIMGKNSAACPKKVKFAALPTRDRWLERALACPGRPIFDQRMREEAIAAERHIAATAARMQRSVHLYAKDIADRYLARYGLSYDTWMAAVAHGASPRLVARAARIEESLLRRAEELRASAGH
jgi:hypothetical protein